MSENIVERCRADTSLDLDDHDPGEKFGQFYPGLFAVTPIQRSLRQHMMLLRKYPHRTSKITPKGAELTPHD